MIADLFDFGFTLGTSKTRRFGIQDVVLVHHVFLVIVT